MSGPFRFQAEEARSPLDRSASPFSAGQPVSFKTNVNRAKTKKWVQAKKNAYDGDDWGDYDEYDEYGVNQEPQQSQAPAQRYYAQRLEQPSRSFTDPSQQAPLPKGRRNSFEHGEEQRAFSSTIPHPQHNYGQQHEEPRIQTNVGGYGQGYDTGERGDFSPSAMPPPLQTRISQVPADFTPPINTQFPPRKSSIGQGDMPAPTSPRSRQGSQSDKPLPFIRPADIYKRHEEERQRASLESSRPSLDSLSSPTRDNITSPTEGGRSLQPMETVAERKSEYYLPDYDAAAPHQDKPQFHQDQSLVSPQDDQGLRSVVDQAFTRADENRSVPPTPISNDNDSSSDLLRSNTGSTSGISPIMSRVPSSAASALRNRNQAEGSTPAIAEEPSETTTPITQPTSANVIEPMHHVPRKPSPGHNRNFSNSSIPRSGLATPTRGDSPARSPVLAPSRDVPEPESALVTTESNETSDAMEGGLQGPSSAYATREADIATAARNGPDNGASELGAAELRSQDTFLESHNAQSPVDDVLPRDRSESPSKGRVQALAGKFGEVASSRRGSTQSNRSRNSIQSWERSNDNSRAGSPTKTTHSRHSSPVKEFRPHLPGQWESYATTAMTPSDHGEQDRGLSLDTSGSNSLNKTDLTPTTPKHPVAGVSAAGTDTSDPIAALRDAGAAMVNSIRTTLGADDNISENQQQQERRTDHGNVYLPRPLQLDRTITSNSSAPPTPPAKDTPESEFPPPAPLKDRSSQPFESQFKRPSLDPQLSTDPSAEDQESDRLRKEIVASLSPFKAPASPASEANRSSLAPVSPGANRASSILPSEYDTYWAEEDRASRRSSHETAQHSQDQPSGKTVSFLPQSEEPTKPVILNRFSWEASNSQLQTPEEQAQDVPVANPTEASTAAVVSSPVEQVAAQERQESSEPLPDSYFGPDHTVTVTKPDSISHTDMPPQPSSPPVDHARSLTSPITSPTREDTRSPGLHVVNTELNPEAVDLPPRFSADHEPSPILKEPDLSEKQQLEQPTEHPAILPPVRDPPAPIAVQDASPMSPTTDKPLGAREIATLATAAERIDAYNGTREYWAKYDHGLNDWLHSALEANPDLAIQSYPVQRAPTSSVRHRHTGSLALFGKLGGSSSHDVSTEQHNNASVPVPAISSSPTTAAPASSGFGGRIANQQMQLKGKDLLHTANVLGGKGMTSAKGLFAKGKSRFGREKTSHARADSAPSSREASEEPELVTRRSRASTGLNLIRSKTEKEKEKSEETPNEEKKKRRFSFSSQFRRASRSRSRPNSVALPKDTPSVFSSTPKTSPPRELHHYLMGERRPHSFHAPDSWVGTPPTALNEYFSTTPPRRSSSQPRLGILPSPAKSAFSNPDRDTADHVPPVPPIPSEVATKHYRRRSSQDSASHRMLQSVIRHSTPPIVPNRHSMPAAITINPNNEYRPVFAEDDPPSSAQERADDYKILLRAPEGSFQPDLPTAESGDLRRDGFQFDFSDEASKRVEHDDMDDDDQPPQLNHDPLPVSSQLDLQQSFRYSNKHMDVSDEDSDKEPVRGRGLAVLPMLETKQKPDSISPVLPPVGPSPGAVSNINDKAMGIKDDEDAHGAGIIKYENTPFVLIPQQPDAVVATERPSADTIGAPGSRENPQSLAKHPSVELEYNTSTRGSSPILPHHRINEISSAERQIGYRDRASDVESPTLGLLDDAFRTGQVRRIPSSEAEVIVARDATPASDTLVDDKDDQTASKLEKTDAERAFSPVWFAKSDLQLPDTNTQGLGDADERAQACAATFAEEPGENARSPPETIGEIAAPAQQQIRGHGETSLSDTLAGANAATADSDTSTRRVSTPPSRGVNAVEGYPASDLVDTSWDHRHSTIEPRVDTDDSDKMRDESDRVTPVAQVPRITQNGPETPKAEEPHDEISHPTMSNGYFRGQGNFPDFKHQAHQLQVSNNATTAPERSRSMLSQISAMVSDDGNNPYSQTSTGRSTPSTIRRMQPDSTMKPSAAPPQIPEEVLTSYGDHTANGRDDDFDLYADHNGVVKDVQDKSGRPLRLADLQVPGTAPRPQPSRSSTSDIGSAPASRDGEHPRYSFERPMSFVSGPEDQDGKPQDQINQAAASNAMQVLPAPEQHRHQPQQSRNMETVYSMNPPASMAPPPDQITSRHQPVPAPGPSPSKNIFHAVKSINPGSKTIQPAIDSWRPSGESVSQQVLSENPNVSYQPPPTNQPSDHMLHEPQRRPMIPGQPVSQDAQNYPQAQVGSREIQAHTQGSVPRNQFEHHQQMMQRQAQYPRHQDAEFRPPTTRSHPSAEQVPRQQEKPSKPRLSSMFKGLGGKTQANSQHPPSTSNTTMLSDSKPLPPNPSYSAPVQSVMDRFTRPREASKERPAEQPRSFVPPNRPSMGQQPQFIQTPLVVPSTDLHRDARVPMTSGASNGFPPLQPPSMPQAQAQSYQVTQSGTPENGKKKRFSGFGALFNRGGVSGDGPAAKSKLSKEGKKAQKAQRSSSVPPVQPPPSQWLPQQQQTYKPQQSGLAYYPPGQLPPHTVRNEPPMGPKLGLSQPAPHMHSQGPPQQYQQVQNMPPARKSMSNTRPEEGSAFLKTKQLAMEHQARQSSLQSHHPLASNAGNAAQSSSRMSESTVPHMRHPSSGPPIGGYYKPQAERPSAEQGAYAASLAARQQAEQHKQQQIPQQGAYAVSQAERQQERQQSAGRQSVHRDPRHTQQSERQTHPGPSPEQLAHQAWLAQREQLRQQGRLTNEHDRSSLNDDARVQQLHLQQQQDQHMEQRQPNNAQPLPYHNASEPRLQHSSQEAVPISPPPVSPMQEPKYDAPPIPAAYNPVSGAFISPLDREQQPIPNQFHRQDSEPRMQTVSPQISAQSPAPPNGRSHSDASTMSLVSPISNSPALPNSSPPPVGQRYQKPRMSSISEVHQQDRPWHLNFPEGATEQEIVRARQGQYMQERFTAQQQQQAERAASSPSPRASPEQMTPTTVPSHAQSQGGGFRELLPRHSSQPDPESQVTQSSHDLQPMVHRDATPVQPTPIRPGQSPPPAAYPLPMSPDPTLIGSPVNPTASGLPPPPPPKVAHSPVRPGFGSTQPFSFENQRQQFHHPSSRDDGYGSSQRVVPQYDEQVPDEAPPSYDGLGVPNDGMNKSRPEALRPPNITTNLEYESRGRQPGSRPRQPSIGILQHPQPASMAASPQRTSPDMGAESLRRQLLQQENLAHMERVQREQEQRERHERERLEREAARARARELERSASGGGQVPSLRSVGGSTTGGPSGWERRGSYSRPVFELPAVEDDEPTMKATSYPGQEWVPPMWDGD